MSFLRVKNISKYQTIDSLTTTSSNLRQWFITRKRQITGRKRAGNEVYM